MSWRDDPPSPRQVSLLKACGISIPKTKGEASDLINKSEKALLKIKNKKIDDIEDLDYDFFWSEFVNR